MLTHELEKGGIVCGIDEVGRGPLAGPVMAACVYIPENKRKLSFWDRVTDSKKLSHKKRVELYPFILDHTYYGVGSVSCAEIDQLNIHHATLLAMKRAFDAMVEDYRVNPDHALIDGKFTPTLPCAATAIVKGDSLSLSIAAASILAKVERDAFMCALHRDYPQYGWLKNAGYGTAMHLEAIRAHGATIHHRLSFSPLRVVGG